MIENSEENETTPAANRAGYLVREFICVLNRNSSSVSRLSRALCAMTSSWSLVDHRISQINYSSDINLWQSHLPSYLSRDFVQEIRVLRPDFSEKFASLCTLDGRLPDELMKNDVVNLLFFLDQLNQVVHLKILSKFFKPFSSRDGGHKQPV